MLRYSFDLETEAQAIEKAVVEVLNKGYRTGDIADKESVVVGTREMSRLVCESIN